MSRIDVVRQWGGAIFAFFTVAIAYGHADAGVEIALAMPMCIFFVCMASYRQGDKSRNFRLRLTICAGRLTANPKIS